MQVVYPSTPAQLFHLLRRQIKRKVAKPLIVFTPKGLLRHPACISAPNDFATGAFGEILDDPQAPKKAKRLILCSGRVYYDAIDEREQRKAKDVAIVRVEQLYPMHTALLDKIFDRYKGIEDCVWLQEEPKNMGAWYFVRPFLQQRFDGNGVKVRYAGRPRSASPAAGSYALHKKQYAALMDAAFNAREEQPEEHP